MSSGSLSRYKESSVTKYSQHRFLVSVLGAERIQSLDVLFQDRTFRQLSICLAQVSLANFLPNMIKIVPVNSLPRSGKGGIRRYFIELLLNNVTDSRCRRRGVEECFKENIEGMYGSVSVRWCLAALTQRQFYIVS